MALDEVLMVNLVVCADPDKATEPGLNEAVPGGTPKERKLTVPVKPLRGVRVML